VNGIAWTKAGSLGSDGYVKIERLWTEGDTVDLVLNMPTRRMLGHPMIRQVAGKTAIQRGPFVYCLEEADNGPHLHEIALLKDGKLQPGFEPDLLGGLEVVTAEGVRMKRESGGDRLYEPDASCRVEPAVLRFIPYYAWANRGRGEMTVWVRSL
jgi:Uncharacterized protein conserved in bacteria